MTIDGYPRGSRRIHNQKREINRDAGRRPSMRKLGVVSTNKLLESAYSDGLVVFHVGKKELMRERRLWLLIIIVKVQKRAIED